MRDRKDKDELVTALFQKEKLKNEKDRSFIQEPQLNEALLRSLAREKMERRLIVSMVISAMVMMDFSLVLIAAFFVNLAPWMIFALSFMMISISFAIVLMFYGLNRLNKYGCDIFFLDPCPYNNGTFSGGPDSHRCLRLS